MKARQEADAEAMRLKGVRPSAGRRWEGADQVVGTDQGGGEEGGGGAGGCCAQVELGTTDWSLPFL